MKGKSHWKNSILLFAYPLPLYNSLCPIKKHSVSHVVVYLYSMNFSFATDTLMVTIFRFLKIDIWRERLVSKNYILGRWKFPWKAGILA